HEVALELLKVRVLDPEVSMGDRREARHEGFSQLLPIHRMHERATELEVAHERRPRVEELGLDRDPAAEADLDLAITPAVAELNRFVDVNRIRLGGHVHVAG